MRMDREMWVKIASWALIILIAPFFLEIALVAEVVGVDVAIGMLVLYASAASTAVRRWIDELGVLATEALRTHADKTRFLQRSLVWNSASSFVIAWVGGSVLTMTLMWMPTFLVASQYL